MRTSRKTGHLDDLIRVSTNPLLIPDLFYIGQECPHGHYRRHKKYHWCLDCAIKIRRNTCGANINKTSVAHRWVYWKVLPYLPSDLNPQECWIIPDQRRSYNETRPCYSTYTYRSYFTGKPESILLSRYFYYWFWGDVGNLTVKRLCKNPCCWNPLHLKSIFNHPEPPSNIDLLNFDIDINVANEFHKQLEQQQQTLFPNKCFIADPRKNANIKLASPFRPLEEIPIETFKC